MRTPKVLATIFHVPGKNDENFERLKVQLRTFDLYIPHVNFYGRKLKAVKDFFTENNYDSMFVICSDVSIVCGDIVKKITEYANDERVGCYGFGTVHNFTYSWMAYSNITKTISVPFVEGYCFGVNSSLIEKLSLDNIYGYGLDLEMGYVAHANQLGCILNNDVCICHQFGKSYSEGEAMVEYDNFLLANPDIRLFAESFSNFRATK